MDKEKLKLIVKNLELLIECLKSEIESDVGSYKTEPQYEDIAPFLDDYDEVFYDEEEDEDLFAHVRVNKKYKDSN